jgi:aldose 1-epimerase
VQASGEQYEIVHGDARAVAVEVGGGLRAFSVGGRDVLLPYAADDLARAARGQVLAPWPNRLADGRYSFGGRELQVPVGEQETQTAIHGLVRFANWTCVRREQAEVELEHVLHPQPGYPFLLRLRVVYRLGADGLEVETSAENAGTGACPFGLAHHPYLAGSVDSLTVSLAAGTRLAVDERKLPVAREPNDLPETFVVGDRQIDATFTDLERLEVTVGEWTVWFDERFPYVQLFTGDHPEVERRGLAVEPMTCPPNAFRSGEGLIVLQPGEMFRGRWGIRALR